jgi:hypothetical protein
VCRIELRRAPVSPAQASAWCFHHSEIFWRARLGGVGVTAVVDTDLVVRMESWGLRYTITRIDVK